MTAGESLVFDLEVSERQSGFESQLEPRPCSCLVQRRAMPS